jgi:hypothetical protein
VSFIVANEVLDIEEYLVRDTAVVQQCSTIVPLSLDPCNAGLLGSSHSQRLQRLGYPKFFGPRRLFDPEASVLSHLT